MRSLFFILSLQILFLAAGIRAKDTSNVPGLRRTYAEDANEAVYGETIYGNYKDQGYTHPHKSDSGGGGSSGGGSSGGGGGSSSGCNWYESWWCDDSGGSSGGGDGSGGDGSGGDGSGGDGSGGDGSGGDGSGGSGSGGATSNSVNDAISNRFGDHNWTSTTNYWLVVAAAAMTVLCLLLAFYTHCWNKHQDLKSSKFESRV